MGFSAGVLQVQRCEQDLNAPQFVLLSFSQSPNLNDVCKKFSHRSSEPVSTVSKKNVVIVFLPYLGPVHTYPEIFVSAIFFYADTPSVHTCPPYTLGVSGFFCIRSPEWKFLYTLCIRIRVDARIRIFLYTLTSQAQLSL